MADEKIINQRRIQLQKADITDLDIESFVFYAREDLQLGSGFGTAISLRGGNSIQEELQKIGSANTTDAVVTSAGTMKASYIVHAVGPKFQEEDIEDKLARTVQNALKQASQKGIKRIAMPAMGAGFYGVPIEKSAKITLGQVKDHLQKNTTIEEVVVCLLDSKQYKTFQQQLDTLA